MSEPVPLQVDHIDGDFLNNLITNLKILCANCHMQTETWGFKGAGAGRFKRWWRNWQPRTPQKRVSSDVRVRPPPGARWRVNQSGHWASLLTSARPRAWASIAPLSAHGRCPAGVGTGPENLHAGSSRAPGDRHLHLPPGATTQPTLMTITTSSRSRRSGEKCRSASGLCSTGRLITKSG